jgi:hypothetical protein
MAVRKTLRCNLYNFALPEPFLFIKGVLNISDTNMATKKACGYI